MKDQKKAGMIAAMMALAGGLAAGSQAFNRAQDTGSHGHGAAPKFQAKGAQAKKRNRRLTAKASRARNMR